jgi:(1->4)-alpha-D-glucan 1-alpha-D-glucosylmutase
MTAAPPPVGRVPRATYRLQLHADFDFAAAARVVPYLARLGISHLYVSPILQAVPGSRHGYDVLDHGRISDDLGGEAGFRGLVATLQAAGMGLVVDLVPNHMAIGGHANRWWWDVLEHGPASRFADHFDVDWDPPESRLRNVILLPVLANHYGRLLEAGQIGLTRRGGALEVTYGAQRFPLDPRSIAGLVETAAVASGSAELGFIGRALGEIPPSTSGDAADLQRRRDDAAVLAARMEVLAADARVAAALDETLHAVAADPDRLDALLEDQNYRLAHWRASSRDLGYRRFFDVNSLIGLRVEREDVFAATHRLILRHVAAGDIQGLRIDHPDGLRDPAGYLRRLRAAAPEAWIVVEKILEHDEELPAEWPIDGTTGYEFGALAVALLTDPTGEPPLSRHWASRAPDLADWEEVARVSRIDAVTDVLGSDLNRLSDLLVTVCETNRRYRDHTRHDLHEALREIVVSFDVYRTYVRPGEGGVAAADRDVVAAAVARAGAQRPDLDPDLFAFIGRVMLLEVPGYPATELALRLQQLTPAAMAKGVEDTALYRYLRLTALNEVGSDPGRFGASAVAFHAAMGAAQVRYPGAMRTTSTHDSKRSEDVRARIGRLSELPDWWAETAVRLGDLAAPHWPADDPPDGPLLELIGQTLIGTWPIAAARLRDYLHKALREARLRTSWTAPDPAYEAAVAALVDGCLADPAFVAALDDAVARILPAARAASLAQLLLKLTVPGTPDIYQGTELWNESLVDPDNRRPIDFEHRMALLSAATEADADPLQDSAGEGLPKLRLLRAALDLRARRPDAFGASGEYRALTLEGPWAEAAVAFARGGAVASIVPLRFARPDAGDWRDTRVHLPDGVWRDQLSGATWDGGPVAMAQLLARFPVALLERVA